MNLGDLAVSSSAFSFGERIPDKYTTEGEDVSPALSITGVPEGAAALAVVVHDPDAPLTDGFTHWVCYDIPAAVGEIPEGGGGAYTEGPNDGGSDGYIGPAPPPGHGTHHYFFHVYALDREIGETGLSRAQLLQRIDGHILEQARLVGTYER